MIRLCVVLLLTIATNGCTSSMLIERDDAACRSQGHTPGSKAYFQCRLREAIR